MTVAAPFISHNLSRITREFMDVFVQGFFVRMINHSQANLATVSSKSTNNRGSVIIISPMASLLVGSASGRIVFIKMLFPFFAGILKHLIGFGDGIFQRGSWLNLNRSLMKFSADGKKRLATESNFPGNCRRRLSFADAAKEKYGLGGSQLLVSKDRSTVEVIDAVTIMASLDHQSARLGCAKFTCFLDTCLAMRAFQALGVEVFHQPLS